MPQTGPALAGPADLTDLLATGLSEKPDEAALVTPTATWTWRELERQIDAYAAHLAAMGLKPGDRVASLVPNRGELLLHYLGCLRAGLVVTPLNYRYTAPEIDYALDLSGASLLLAHAERRADMEASALAKNLPLGLIAVGGPLGDTTRLEDLLERERPAATLPAPDMAAPAFVFFTSGSTAKPKGVTHSLTSFGSIVASWSQAMGLTTGDIVFPCGSIAHVGSLCTALAGLAAGTRVVLPRSFDADEILTLLRQHRPSVLLTLPAVLIGLERDERVTREDFGSLRLCITGGDKIPVIVEDEFIARTGLMINETYGLTEATGCLFNPSQSSAKEGS